MTLEERRASAISGRAWKPYDGPTRAQPSQVEAAAETERLTRDMRDLKATNAILGNSLRKMKAENDKLRTMLRAALESAFGADWEEQLRGAMNDGEHADGDSEGNDGAPQGE